MKKIRPIGLTRRQLIATSAMGLLATPVFAQEALNPQDPRAIALGYRSNHRDVDVSRWPKKRGENPQQPQRCASCAQLAENGGCRLFAGKRVAANGWCNAWTAL